ncbi:MAG: hypothetical protein JW795_11635 [Chitinivibrionales bacterium]|nr:hypothetical protein [Chitinivibrionales bacterium]
MKTKGTTKTITSTVGKALQMVKEWQKYVHTDTIAQLLKALEYLTKYEEELTAFERSELCTLCKAIWVALPSVQSNAHFKPILIKLIHKFPALYANIFLLGWRDHDQDDVLETIRFLQTLPKKEYRHNEWHETVAEIVSVWLCTDPYQLPDWFKHALINLTECDCFYAVIDELVQRCVLQEHGLEDVLNSTAALVMMNDLEIFKQCLQMAILKKFYTLYYPSVRTAIDTVKGAWEHKKQEMVEKAISLLTAVCDSGFFTSAISDVLLEARKRQRPLTWYEPSNEWEAEAQEFVLSGDYKRDEIREMLRLFGPSILPAAKALVLQEKKDSILRRGALVFITEAIVLSTQGTVAATQQQSSKPLQNLTKKVSSGFRFWRSSSRQRKFNPPGQQDFNLLLQDGQHIQLLKSLCANKQESDQWCYDEAYATLTMLQGYNTAATSPETTGIQRDDLDIISIANVIFREHCRSIMQNLSKVASHGMDQERVIISIHESIDAVRHFSTDMRIAILLQLLESLTISELETITHILSTSGLNQEQYPIPATMAETMHLCRYFFLRRLLFENKQTGMPTIQSYVNLTTIADCGGRREIIGYLQSLGGSLVQSLRSVKNSVIILTALAAVFLFQHQSAGQEEQRSSPVFTDSTTGAIARSSTGGGGSASPERNSLRRQETSPSPAETTQANAIILGREIIGSELSAEAPPAAMPYFPLDTALASPSSVPAEPIDTSDIISWFQKTFNHSIFHSGSQTIKNLTDSTATTSLLTTLFSQPSDSTPQLITIQNSQEALSIIIGKEQASLLLIWILIALFLVFLFFILKALIIRNKLSKRQKRHTRFTIEQALTILETDPWVSKEGLEEIVNPDALAALDAIAEISPIHYSEKMMQTMRIRLIKAWRRKDLLNMHDQLRKKLAGCRLVIEGLTDVVMATCPNYATALKLGVSKRDLTSRAIDQLQKIGTIRVSNHERSALENALVYCILKCRTKEFGEIDRNQLMYFVNKLGTQTLLPVIQTGIERECAAVKKEPYSETDGQTSLVRSGLVILFTTILNRLAPQQTTIENIKLLQVIYRTFSTVKNDSSCFLESETTLMLLNRKEPSAEAIINYLFHLINHRIRNSTKRLLHEGEKILAAAVEFLKSQELLVSVMQKAAQLNSKELHAIATLYKELEQTMQNAQMKEPLYWQLKAKLYIIEALLASNEVRDPEIISILKSLPYKGAQEKLALWASAAIIDLRRAGQTAKSSHASSVFLYDIIGDIHLENHKGLLEIIDALFIEESRPELHPPLEEIERILNLLTLWHYINAEQIPESTRRLVGRLFSTIPQNITSPVLDSFGKSTLVRQVAATFKSGCSRQAELLKLQKRYRIYPEENRKKINGDTAFLSQNSQHIITTIVGTPMYEHLKAVFLDDLQPWNLDRRGEVLSFFLYLTFTRAYYHLDTTSQEILQGILAHIPSKDLERLFDYYAEKPILKEIITEFNTYRTRDAAAASIDMFVWSKEKSPAAVKTASW